MIRVLRPQFIVKAMSWKPNVRDFILDLIMAEHVLVADHAELLNDYLRWLTRKREGCIA